MNYKEAYAIAKKTNRQRGGDDWSFDRDNRLDVKQRNGGVSLVWFDWVAGIYRRTYVKGAIFFA